MRVTTSIFRARAPVFEALEPSLPYAGDATPLVLTAPVALAGGDVYGITLQANASAQSGLASQNSGQATAPRELAVVDARVPDADALLTAQRYAGRLIAVIRLAPGEDGIGRINQGLTDGRGLFGAIHLFGHGQSGAVQWGDAALDLAALTGADVAASDDATGAAPWGGDLTLETRHGASKTRMPLGDDIQRGHQGVLANAPAWPTVGNALDEGPYFEVPSASIKVAENTSESFNMEATDPESESPVYGWSDDDASGFTITDGRLSFDAPPDFETPRERCSDKTSIVTVAVSDGVNQASQTLTINVRPVDEFAPTFDHQEALGNRATVAEVVATVPIVLIASDKDKITARQLQPMSYRLKSLEDISYITDIDGNTTANDAEMFAIEAMSGRSD